ncbi:GNAT family N-acetyltransferase [Paenibacillus pinisoli]|uniref:GNAT family N-acetyltransferase n=1 Tax=Paenibacillus pinisoli TaxID=1276110 RepID=A0A3A6PIX3_9BACL|nr:GNAT family N-acetyltransferase [Paenibacillus pinisoli]RJX38239.1 GNAT family N-acetyltransferase [Paenibacillus pinisoli]
MQERKLGNRRIEELSLNGWPALQTILQDGWLLRFTEGYTKRSNSVQPIYGFSGDLDRQIGRCEELYRAQGQPVVFKITPFAEPGTLDARLEELGYERIDHTLVKTASIDELPEPRYGEGFHWSAELTDEWLEAIVRLQGLSDRARDTTRRMLAGQPLRRAFGLFKRGDVPVAAGMVVLEEGYAGLYDIVTDASERGRGYGEALTLGLLGWAGEHGARMAYLLVVKSNAAANRLYDKFGFMTQYEYWYRVKK